MDALCFSHFSGQYVQVVSASGACECEECIQRNFRNIYQLFCGIEVRAQGDHSPRFAIGIRTKYLTKWERMLL